MNGWLVSEKSKYHNLFPIGTKFGRWEVIDSAAYIKSRSEGARLVCRCECGEKDFVRANSLVYNKSTQCHSCIIKTANKGRTKSCKIENGTVFGRLTVLNKVVKGKTLYARYLCLCECGRTIITRQTYLKMGKTTQCLSCYQRLRSSNFSHTVTKNTAIGDLRFEIYRRIVKRAIQIGTPSASVVSQQYMWDLFLAQNRICALSGVELHFRQGVTDKRRIFHLASLDRIDSRKGYIKGNVQWVCSKINVSKSTMTQQEFIEMCTRVAKHNES